mmetsp:Transcript_3513/g.6370  ORF Transcript_3513/g.6370 Transcript_3513/m.6370 type:complete len:142 (+) Transcript_3513:40-465(+)
MNFKLAVVALTSVFGCADATPAPKTNAPVITLSNEGESEINEIKLAECEDPKCVGFWACYGIDQSKVGCGSCIGDMACSGYTGDSIGEKSCTVADSCPDATATIGKNSCNAHHACTEATGYIGSKQCNSKYECAVEHFPSE